MRMNYLEYLRYGPRVFWKRGADPLYLIFFITSRCTAACDHCFNWPRSGRDVPDLSFDEYRRISARMAPLPFLFLTGGEAFLRDDFADLAELFHRNNRVQKMQTPSNGSLPDSIRTQMGKLLRRCPDLHYSVTLSVDALGPAHDQSRHRPGLFDTVLESHRVLLDLQRRHSNLGINFAITVSRANQDSLLETYRFLRERAGAENVFAILVRGRPRDPGAVEVDPERYRGLMEQANCDLLRSRTKGYFGFPFASWMNAKEIRTREIVYQVARERRQQLPCLAGVLSGVVYNDGDVFPCELLESRLGNLREMDYDLRAIWRSATARAVAERIAATRCFCTHECFLTANLLFNPGPLLSVTRTWLAMRAGRWVPHRVGGAGS